MAAKRVWQCLTLVGLAAVSACATTMGTSVPPPGLRQELDEGLASWFFNATSALQLSYTEQDQLLKLGQTLRAESEGVQVARRQLLGLLLEGIASGNFDEARLTAQIQTIVSASEERGPAVAQALLELYRSLDQTQRASVASSVKQAVNGQAAQPKDERKQLQQRVDSLTRGVGLTDAQSQQIRTSITDSYRTFSPDLQEEAAQRRKQLNGLATGFAGLYFEPTVANVTTAWDLKGKSERLVAFSRTLTAILTPPQRQQVAALIRQRNSID